MSWVARNPIRGHLLLVKVCSPSRVWSEPVLAVGGICDCQPWRYRLIWTQVFKWHTVSMHVCCQEFMREKLEREKKRAVHVVSFWKMIKYPNFRMTKNLKPCKLTPKSCNMCKDILWQAQWRLGHLMEAVSGGYQSRDEDAYKWCFFHFLFFL